MRHSGTLPIHSGRNMPVFHLNALLNKTALFREEPNTPEFLIYATFGKSATLSTTIYGNKLLQVTQGMISTHTLQGLVVHLQENSRHQD